MNTLDHIIKKHNIKTDYIEIPNVGRDKLAVLCKELGYKKGVEIGVASGDYSEVIMKANHNFVSNFWMYGVDPYVSYAGYKDYKRKSTFQSMEQSAHEKLEKYPTYVFVKKFSVEASKDFDDNALDFCYIDGNHDGEHVLEDLEAWVPKVRKGGIVAGHDFTGRWPSLQKVVIDYCKKNEKQLFVLGMERKDLGLYRDVSRSWMFVV